MCDCLLFNLNPLGNSQVKISPEKFSQLVDLKTGEIAGRGESTYCIGRKFCGFQHFVTVFSNAFLFRNDYIAFSC